MSEDELFLAAGLFNAGGMNTRVYSRASKDDEFSILDTLDNHDKDVLDCFFTPDALNLFTASADGTIILNKRADLNSKFSDGPSETFTDPDNGSKSWEKRSISSFDVSEDLKMLVYVNNYKRIYIL